MYGNDYNISVLDNFLDFQTFLYQPVMYLSHSVVFCSCYPQRISCYYCGYFLNHHSSTGASLIHSHAIGKSNSGTSC